MLIQLKTHFAVMAALLVLAGCAQHAVRPATEAATPSPIRATVVAIRHLPTTTTGAPVLQAIGSKPTAGAAGAEYILRTEDGRLISLVQPDDPAVKRGDQVVLVDGQRLRLAHTL
jgi:hypothetical protein